MSILNHTLKRLCASFVVIALINGCTDEQPLATGAIPNDIVLSLRNNAVYALVLSSGDSELQFFNLSEKGETPQSLRLPEEKGVGANPLSIALSASQQKAAISLYGYNKIALVNLWDKKVLATVGPEKNGVWAQVDVHLATPLRKAVDAQNNGILESNVTRMALKNPQGLGFLGDNIIVSFANILEYATMKANENASFGPGVAALFNTNQDALSYESFIQLPFMNPGAVVPDNTSSVWVSCAGVFGIKDQRWQALTEGGLVQLSLNSQLKIEHTLSLGTFGGGRPVVTPSHLIVPSQTMAAIWVGKKSATQFSEGKVVFFGPAEQTDTTHVALIDKNRLAVTLFSSNKIYTYTIDEAQEEPILNTKITLYEKQEDTLIRGAGSSAFIQQGNEIIGGVLLNQSAQLVPVRLGLK